MAKTGVTLLEQWLAKVLDPLIFMSRRARTELVISSELALGQVIDYM